MAKRRRDASGEPDATLEVLPGGAHGFSGSQQLMLAYGYTLAHAGYAVILLDFAGHGANAQPLRQDAALPQPTASTAVTSGT